MLKNDLYQVIEVQKKTFGTELCESYEVFLNRFELFGQFFKVASFNDLVQGYMICFPWKLGESPVNNQKFPDTLPFFDCFYLHDIALLESLRGQGIAQELLNQAKSSAQGLGMSSLSLVSVEQSGDYWDRRGFLPIENLSPKKQEFIKIVYGLKARLMVLNF